MFCFFGRRGKNLSDKKYLYIRTDGTKYEIPVYVCDTTKELAEKCGVTQNSIISAIYHAKKNGTNSIYKRVEREEED